MSDEQMKPAEALYQGNERLAALQEMLLHAQRTLEAAALCFHLAGSAPPEETPQPQDDPISEDTIVVGRDANGEFMAVRANGEVVYRNPGVEFYKGPFTFWISKDGEILRKMHVWDEREWRLA